MLKEFIAKTGYKITAEAILKGCRIKNSIATNIGRPLSADTVEFSQKTMREYCPIVLPKLKVSEIGQLENLFDNDFVLESKKILSKILGIPEEISPHLAYLYSSENNFIARYRVSLHRIELPCDFFEMSSREQFSTLAHEMKHAEQELAILRSRKLAPILIEDCQRNFKEITYPFSLISPKDDMLNKPEDLKTLSEKAIRLMGELPESQNKYIKKFLNPSKKTGSIGYFLSSEEIEAYIFERLISAEYKKAAKTYYSNIN